MENTRGRSASMTWVMICALLYGATAERSYAMVRLAHMGGVAAAQAGVASALVTQVRHLLPGQENHPFWVKISQEIQEFTQNHGITMPTEAELRKVTHKFPGTLEGYKKEREAWELRMLEIAALCCSDAYHNASWLKKNHAIIELLRSKTRLEFLGSFLSRQAEFEAMPETMEMKKIRALAAQIFANHGIQDTPVRFVVKNNPESPATLACVDVKNELCIFPKFMKLTSPAQQQAALEHEACHIIHQDAARKTWLRKVCTSDFSPAVLTDFDMLIEKRADIHAGIQSLQSAQQLPQAYAKLHKLYQLLKLSPKQDAMKMVRLCFAPNYMQELIAYMKQHNS